MNSAFERLLGDWGLTSVIAVLSLVVSMVTVQLSFLVRRRENFEKLKMMKLEEEKLRQMHLMEIKQREQFEMIRKERYQIRNNLIHQQLDLLKSELDRIATHGDTVQRLSAAKQIIAMLEESLKSLDKV